LRAATRADLPRIHVVRHGTAENRLTDPSLVTDAEVAWYMDKAIFLVSEDEAGGRASPAPTTRPAMCGPFS